MLDQTAQGAYGFNSWTPAAPGGVATIPETQTGNSGPPGAVLKGLPLHWGNPLFWLLALVLVFTGWLYLGADFGIKRVGEARFKVGR